MSQYIVDKEGKRTHVVLTIEEYEELLDALRKTEIEVPPDVAERLDNMADEEFVDYKKEILWGEINACEDC